MVQAALPEPVLVKNIESRPVPVPAAAQAVRLGQSSLLVLDDAVHGAELWLTDGTTAGTRLLKDIWPGETASGIAELTVSGDRVFFSADDGQHGPELWVTDGTEAGTQMAMDLVGRPQAGAQPKTLTPFKDGILFSGTHGDQSGLWWSDGTEAGTRWLINTPTPQGHVVGGLFYFTHASALWKTDGTLAGTVKIKAFPYVENSPPVVIGSFGQTALLSVMTAGKGYRLWKSNGVPAGTVLFSSAARLDYTAFPLETLTAGGKTYVRVRSYGLNSVHEIDPQGRSIQPTSFQLLNDDRLMPLGDKVLKAFYATVNSQCFDPATRTWTEIPHRSDSTGSSANSAPMEIKVVGTRAVFATVNSGRRLMWVTDGTVAGTQPLSTGFSAEGDTDYGSGLISDGTRAFFTARRPGETPVQWSTDGTAAGTQPLLSLPLRYEGAAPADLCRISDSLMYFSARDAEHGREIWKSDGTGAGTVLMQDIVPGVESSSPAGITAAGGSIAFFSASPTTVGEDLWRTDGTAFKRWDDASSDEIRYLTLFNFGPRAAAIDSRWNAFLQRRIYRVGVSDPQGSYLFSYAQWNLDDQPRLITVVGSSLYFVCDAESRSNQELYRFTATESSPNGTFTLIGTFPAVGQLAAGPIPAPGEEPLLYFTASQGSRLYTCTRTGIPTQVTLALSHSISSLQAWGNEMLFASNGTLWLSTRGSLKPFLPSGTCTPFTVVGDTLYYLRNDLQGRFDLECIQSDGSGRQVLLRHGFNPGLTRVHEEAGTLYFARRTSETGAWTLWQSQGTPESTLEIPHSRRTSVYAQQDRVAVLGDRLFFSGENPADGRQLYSLDLSGRLEVTDVTDAARPRPLSNESVVDLGIAPQPRILRLRNAGQRPLGQITLTHAYISPFEISTGTVAGLAPGETADVEISFATFNAGTYTEELRFAVAGSSHHLHLNRLSIRGQQRAGGAAPEFWQQPRSAIALEGQQITLQAQYAGQADGGLNWTRDGIPVLATGSSQPDECIVTATAGSAGAYARWAGDVRSNLAYVAVVQPASALEFGLEGGSIAFQCLAYAPVGTGLSYQWLKNGIPLAGAGGFQGARSALLEISNLDRWSSPAVYECLVTFTAPDGISSLSAGSTELRLMNGPEVPFPAEGLSNYVGEEVSYRLLGNEPVQRYIVKGLPPGLIVTPSGFIIGRPTKALGINPDNGQRLSYTVTVTAINAAGPGSTTALRWTIHPQFRPGGYDCVLPPLTEDFGKSDLGGRVQFTASPAGSLSGQVRLHGKNYRFATVPPARQILQQDETVRVVEFPVTRERGQDPLRLTLIIDRQDINLTAEIGDTYVNTAPVYPHFATNYSFRPLSVGDLTGLYTWIMRDNQDSMQGVSHGTATVSRTGGNILWKGRLADGTTITGSSPLLTHPAIASIYGPDHYSFLPRQELYRGTGIVSGQVRLMRTASTTSPIPVEGELDWRKAPLPEAAAAKERNYPDGIEVLGTVTGTQYTSPETLQTQVTLADLGLDDLPDNVWLQLQGDGIREDQIYHLLTLTSKGVAKLRPLGDTHILKSFSLSLKQGTFKGSLVITDFNPENPSSPWVRTATFEGVLLPALGYAAGSFLLPDLPPAGSPANALKTTRLRSKSLFWEPTPRE